MVPDPGEDERLSQWVVRLASLNNATVQAICGRPVQLGRLDRTANPAVIDHLAESARISHDRLRQMTLAGKYPGAATRHGTVLLGKARCPAEAVCTSCDAPTGVSGLLRLMPLCVDCGRLLDDGSGYQEIDIDSRLVDIQRAVDLQARQAEGLATLSHRIDTLRQQIRPGWPPFPRNEPSARLRHALQLLADDPSTWSPAVVAVLLYRAYDPDYFRYQELYWRRNNIGWTPPAGEVGPEPLADVPTELHKLHETVRRLGIEVRHVPLAIVFGSPSVPPRGATFSSPTLRAVWAATLRQQVEHATGTHPMIGGVPETRTQPWELHDAWTVRLLTNTAITLHREGLLDRDLAVETFWGRTVVPAKVLRQLPVAARNVLCAERVAATWIWSAMSGTGAMYLDLLKFVNEPDLLRHFDEASNAEGRLALVDYALHEMGGWADTLHDLAGRRGRLISHADRDAG